MLVLVLAVLVESVSGNHPAPPPPLLPVLNNTVNVRTVLFKESDTCKVCWSKHDLNLLIARRLVQDLIPRKIPKDFPRLLQYFNNIIEGMKGKCNEKNIHTMLAALYDALGGYLYSVGIPVLNEAYYAGNVDFDTASQLHNMLGLMMEYLGTNGNNWSPPCDMRKIPTKVTALPIKMCKVQEACDAFVIPSMTQGNKSVSEESGDWCPEKSIQSSKIQIPFLDDNAYPSAIAVPLKDHPLFSLMSECSVNLIPKYYILGMRCLSSSNFTSKDIVSFNKGLHHWIVASVVPHLHETSRWFPGFGSVMRVIETMNQRGLASSEAIKPDVVPLSQKGSCADLNVDIKESKAGGGGGEAGGIGIPIWLLVLIALAMLLLFLILCCFIHCCIVVRKRRREGFEECEDEKVINPLVNIYCGLRKKKDSSKYEGKARSGSSVHSYDESSEESDEDED